MSDEIEWKEAISRQEPSDTEEHTENNEQTSEDEYNSNWGDDDDNNDHETSDAKSNDQQPVDQATEPPTEEISPPNYANTVPVYERVNLNYRRNITALADINQHKPKPAHDAILAQSEPFDRWMERALVAISPNADLILFASDSPEKMAFIAKLRLDPINQYTTNPLSIPLDHSEQITSLLCLPMMSTQKTALGLVDWTALVVGSSSGYVKFYTEQSICLLILKFCDEPVISLRCQTQKYNSNARSESHFATIIDELLVVYRTSSVIVDGIGLFENLRISNQESIRNGSDYEPAYTMSNLPNILTSQKWKPDELKGQIIDADSLGTRRVTLFDSLVSDSINFERSSTKSLARHVAFVGKTPFISFCREPKDLSTHTYTEIIGSIFSYWNRPEPSRHQQTEVTRPASISLYDRERLATSIVSSPDKRLAAVTDDFGRVLLLDETNMIVIRVWKGYRSAQCGWVEVQQDPEVPDSPRASFLVIYAPKRGLLEVWSAQRGPRVAAFNVGRSCTLLYCGYKMFNMRGEQTHRSTSPGARLIDQAYSSNCYLLNASSETVFAIDLPFTYSLYKYDDLKSRDRLLINELNGSIERDSDIEVVSEILNRLILAESLEVSIQRIALTLSPDQIIPIVENLIINIMKKYDNHSGETINDEDSSILELCRRLIRLCAIFKDLSDTPMQELSLPDVNQRLIESYEEHPQEIDAVSEQLGWPTPEILRFLSLLSLERSYRKDHITNPWPSIGEPLTWLEFVSCFDCNRIYHETKGQQSSSGTERLCIRLKEFNNSFLSQDSVMKTALFMYNRLSENYYRSTLSKQSSETYNTKANSYNILEPSSRLALLFQFWLSTKLCNHWKMWTFLQNQVGQISDELKVLSMSQDDDSVLIGTWKQIYHLILESDNIFASIIATASIKSDTIRMIQDDEKREKLKKENQVEENAAGSSVDWETLCIDAERMSLLSQQLEDVFLINLLLKYSVRDARLVGEYMYRVPRISVANVIRGGPTVVSELIAQWAVQSEVRLDIFTQPYGENQDTVECQRIDSDSRSRLSYNLSRFLNLDNEEHAKELLHHVKSSFPCSLQPDVILLNCIWELCRQWTSDKAASQDRSSLLRRAFSGLSLISESKLRHKVATVAYKTFFQRMFEKLMILAETNGTIASTKYSKARDKIIRKELNISDDCLDSFIRFVCDLSEFMLQTSNNRDAHLADEQDDPEQEDLHERLLALDDWWLTSRGDKQTVHERESPTENSLVKTTLFNSGPITISSLIELNRAATLMNLVFRLGIIKANPISLIGEESRQLLHLDQQQPVSQQTTLNSQDSKIQSGSLMELRQKFARKCIVSVVRNMTEEQSADDQAKFREQDGSDDEDHYDDASDEASKRDYTQSSSADNNLHSDFDYRNETEEGGTNNEAMALFADLLSLSNEWQLNCDELHLELVFELYRCNLDKIGAQISNRVIDQQTLSNGLLKIASQRLLMLFGLSPNFASGTKWHSRSDRWSLFQPNVSSWLKGIQQEEMKRDIASLNFLEPLKRPDNQLVRDTFGVEVFVLHALRRRTKLMLDNITNHLDGQAGRLAHDLLQILKSQMFIKFLESEIGQKASARVDE